MTDIYPEPALNDLEFIRRLRKLVGRHCRYLGRHYLLVDILQDEAVLVLRREDGAPPIQGNQFGHAMRRAVETLEVPIFNDPERDKLSEDVLDLLSALNPKDRDQ